MKMNKIMAGIGVSAMALGLVGAVLPTQADARAEIGIPKVGKEVTAKQDRNGKLLFIDTFKKKTNVIGELKIPKGDKYIVRHDAKVVVVQGVPHAEVIHLKSGKKAFVSLLDVKQDAFNPVLIKR